MAVKSVLAIEIQSDASDASAAFDKVGSSAESMGKSVDTASKKADTATSRLEGAAEGADALDSKAAQATGSLGALSSGFELVGADKYATGLQSAALATDFFAGVGEGANLILESSAGLQVKNTALKIKDAVVSKTSAAATAVMTAAQVALNAVMSANPIALVILGLVALTAAFVVAYKKSDTFRKIVNGAFNAVRKVVVGLVSKTVGFVKDHWPLLLAILTGPFGLAFLAVTKWRGKITGAISSTLSKIKSTASSIGRGILDALTYPFRQGPSIVASGMARVSSAVLDRLSKIRDGVVTRGARVLDWFRDLPSKILNAVGDLGSVLLHAGEDLIQGFIDGIGNKFGAVKDKLGDLTDSLTSWKGPPSKDKRLLTPVGELIIDGLVAGFDSRRAKVKNALQSLTTDIRDGVQAATADPITLNGTMTADPSSALAGRGVQIVIQGAVDPYSTAAQIKAILTRGETITGRVVGVAG